MLRIGFPLLFASGFRISFELCFREKAMAQKAHQKEQANVVRVVTTCPIHRSCMNVCT
jgi:hypothetical protein